jgi:hypothetical protein
MVAAIDEEVGRVPRHLAEVEDRVVILLGVIAFTS